MVVWCGSGLRMGWDGTTFLFTEIPWDGMMVRSHGIFSFFSSWKNKFFPVEIRIENILYEQWVVELIIISLLGSLFNKNKFFPGFLILFFVKNVNHFIGLSCALCTWYILFSLMFVCFHSHSSHLSFAPLRFLLFLFHSFCSCSIFCCSESERMCWNACIHERRGWQR